MTTEATGACSAIQAIPSRNQAPETAPGFCNSIVELYITSTGPLRGSQLTQTPKTA